jgi:hypothetical protein
MDRSLPTDTLAPPLRLDRALAVDLQAATRRPVILAFLALEVAAGAFIVARRGGPGAESVGFVWLGLGVVAFLAWWSGRHRRAVERPDPVGRAGGRLLSALVGVAGIGLVTWGLSASLGVAMVLAAIVGWLVFAVLGRNAGDHLPAQLLRDPRPFVPLLLLMGVPRAIASGPIYAVQAIVALPSGISQQLALLLGFFAPLEAVLRRTDLAAVISALAFGALHVPMNLPQAGGDVLLATANAMVFQATVGAIACLGYVRHRAAVPLGVAHALAIA